MASLKEIAARLVDTGETQISLTDPDARSIMTRGSGIVKHEVTNTGKDRDQLFGMAKKARTAIGKKELAALADRGYFSGKEILACHEAGIATLVPPTKTSHAKADGRFDKADFIYDAEKNAYVCPAGQALIWRFVTTEKVCHVGGAVGQRDERSVRHWRHQRVRQLHQSPVPRPAHHHS